MSVQYVFARWVLPVGEEPIAHGFVSIQDGRILSVGCVDDLPSNVQAAYTPGQQCSWLTPGLVNTHAHLELSFSRSVQLLPDETMADWLIHVVKLSREHSVSDLKRGRCLYGAREMLKSGTTCVNDISSDGISLDVLNTLGMRGVVSLEFFHPDSRSVSVSHVVRVFQELWEQWKSHPLLKLGISPHSLYNVSPAAWQAVLEQTTPYLVHTHLAEFVDECHWLKGDTSGVNKLHQRILGEQYTPQEGGKGLTPVEYLKHFDLLQEGLVAAHGVEMTESDWKQCASAGVGLAHCPRSNQALHGKTLNWKQVNPSVPIGLGTDSRLSVENLDLRSEARRAKAFHRWSDEETLFYLTLGGARVLGLSESIGSLESGKSADFVQWTPAASEVAPEVFEDPYGWLSPSVSASQVYIQGQSVN